VAWSGVPRSKILKHLEQKKYSARLMDGRTISSLVSAAEHHVTSSFESDPKVRNVRLAECSMLARIKDNKDVGRSEAIPEGKMQCIEGEFTVLPASSFFRRFCVCFAFLMSLPRL
jgi:hypothetical protein